MKNELNFLIIAFLLFGLMGFSPMKTIIVEEPAVAGQEFQTHVNVRNDLDSKVEGVSVRMFIYDLGLDLYSNEFDMPKKDSTGLWVFGQMPSYVPPGDYLVRVTTSNDHFREVQHVYIAVE
ncbi:hypothetical protein J4209_02720 [Candidatus Woesearchaeota archaeon]|nr:hypothetical protein [Candidatus Woesearchaeota archaeon]